jgi:hypothetical protein
MARSLQRHETMTKLEGNGLVVRIAQSTGLQPEKVAEVVQLALEEIHRITIVDEKGPTAAVMEACFSFGDKAAFHLIGLYVSEHDYHGRGDDAGIWNEVAMRFIPTAYAEGCDRIAPWFREKTPARLLQDADIRTSKHAGRREINSSILPMSRSYVMMDGPGPFSTLATWEQHLKDVKALPDSALNKRDLIAWAERWIDIKRHEVGDKAIDQPNNHNSHSPQPRRPNAGMIFGRAAKRLGRDSEDTQLAKAGQDLLRRSYDELEESEPNSASLTNSSAQFALDLPPNSLEKRKVLSAGKIDGGVSRWVKEPDGSSVVETWEVGKGWVPGGASIAEVVDAPPVSSELASRMGIPSGDLP